MELLSAGGLSKRFGGIVALNEASFSATAGEVHALLGENGAGKSTFIQILAGVLRADQGRILLDGADYAPRDPDAAARRGIVTVFQELSSIPDLSVEGNIWFRREPRTVLRTVSRREVRRRTEALFDRYRFPAIHPGQDLRRLALPSARSSRLPRRSRRSRVSSSSTRRRRRSPRARPNGCST
jgi:ribose transport system ATP-binding protein